MKLALVVNQAEMEIEIVEPAPACRFRLSGTERCANVEVAQPGVYSVLLDGRSYDAWVERTERALLVTIDGYRFEIEVQDPRRWTARTGRGPGEGRETLFAPMPGKIVRVLVAAGDVVEAGQGILVVEAMKMQNEMKASRPGRVVTIQARVGATVAAGETLATIE